MRYIKLYESFEDIDQTCQKYHIENYTINQDGSIDVNGEVNLSRQGLIELPLNFNIVNTFFDCSLNKLTSLKGCPKKVGGDFYCQINDLISLEGSPELINETFDCGYNYLITLTGGPRKVEKNYYCKNNNLINMKGFPENFRGRMNIENNPIYEIVDKLELTNNIRFIECLNKFNVITGKYINTEKLKDAFREVTQREVDLAKISFVNYLIL